MDDALDFLVRELDERSLELEHHEAEAVLRRVGRVEEEL